MKSQGYVTMPVAGRILNRRPEVVRRWVIDGRLPFREYKGYRYVERDACERIAKLDNRPPLTIYE